MRLLISLGLGLMLAVGAQGQVPATPDASPNTAPDSAQDQSGINTIRARTSLVLVPALVTTKDGKPVFTLTPDDFVLTDDGVPQTTRLEECLQEESRVLRSTHFE